ncbi:MAG: putative secreted protein [Glaciihabitans sp.]|nr:putative secreted protein [Glaciihabitans sp.]
MFDLTAVLVFTTLNPARESFTSSGSEASIVASPLGGQDTQVSSTLPGKAMLQTMPAAVSFLAPTIINAAQVPSALSATSSVAQLSRSELASMSGTPLLQQLGMLGGADLSRFVIANPDAINTLLADPPAGREVTGWWQSLGQAERSSLRTGAAQLIGNLDGIPVETRNAANRNWLTSAAAALDATVNTSTTPTVVSESRHQAHLLAEVSAALVETEGGPQRSLLSVDDVDQGRAAVVLGDLASADFVTYLVPGMFFTVDGQMFDWTEAAEGIYTEQARWLQLLAGRDRTFSDKTVAVVAWMGYETPDLTNIGSLELAAKGEGALATVIQGLQSERSGAEPYISIIAHSYGSTTAMMALADYELNIDALTVLGSPGSPATSVDDLSVRGGNVFVGEAAWDPVAHTAYFGSDPGSSQFGAKTMDINGGIDAITDDDLSAAIGHNGYFDVGSESVRNLALVGIGQAELVTDGSTSDETKTLALVR